METRTPTSARVRAPEVMVSYSSQDRERVMQFVRALRGSGVAVWIDQGGIDGAQRWSEEIVNAIEACRSVLLFLSRSSMESQNIAKEVALAWESGKHFLPVALEEVKIPKSMQYQLADIQYVKLFEGDPDVKFESVLRALVRPLALGLFVGAACAEVATSMLITTLRDLGGGPPPDPVLLGTLAFFVGVRSLVFAAVFWAGLKATGIGKPAAN